VCQKRIPRPSADYFVVGRRQKEKFVRALGHRLSKSMVRGANVNDY
jgi:hypothetical protein